MSEDKNLNNDNEDTISLADSDTTTDTYATVVNEEDLHVTKLPQYILQNVFTNLCYFIRTK